MGETGKFYSWEIIDNITAIKNCDKSFFQHRGSGVPREIRWFFDFKDIQNGEQRPLILIYKNNFENIPIINIYLNIKFT